MTETQAPKPASIARSAATIGGTTMVSRLLGFLRDVMMASALGTGPVADAFFVAFRFPNMFRSIFAEGAFNAAFVPLSQSASKARAGRPPGVSPRTRCRCCSSRCWC